MRYGIVLFDVGDTLIEDSVHISERYLERVRNLGFPSIANEKKFDIDRMLKRAEYEQLAKEYNGAPRMPDAEFADMLDFAALSAVFEKSEAERLLPRLREIPHISAAKMVQSDAVPLLERFAANGQRMGIVSNYTADLRGFLEEAGLTRYFETIVISAEVGAEKPDPKIMRIALESAGVSAENALYVGDHPFDVLCAKLAGMDCAWLAPPDRKLPDAIGFAETYRIGRLAELESICG